MLSRGASKSAVLMLTSLTVENDSFNAQPQAPASPGPAAKKAGACGWALNEHICHCSHVEAYVTQEAGGIGVHYARPEYTNPRGSHEPSKPTRPEAKKPGHNGRTA